MAELLSLAGMISMLCVSLLAFTSGLFSLRYVFIAFLLGVNVVKNYQFSKLLAATPLQTLSSGWYKEAKKNFMLCMVPGVVFFLLFNRTINLRLLLLFVDGRDLQYKPEYYLYLPLLFHILFLYMTGKWYIKASTYFIVEDNNTDLAVFKRSSQAIVIVQAETDIAVTDDAK